MTMPSHPSQPHGQTGGPFAVRRRHLQHFNFRPFQRHLSRTMATMQSPATSSAEQDLVDLGLEHGGSQLTAGSHDRPLFEQFLQDPEDSHISQWRQGDLTNPAFNDSFSSTGSFHSTGSFGSIGSFNGSGSFGSGSDLSMSFSGGLPHKIETSPHMPTPTLLSQAVDTSQYANVENDDWMLSSVEYDAPSPASLGTLSNDPCTPVSPRGGDAFLRYPLSGNYQSSGLAADGISKFEGAGVTTHAHTPFQGTCKCVGCTGTFPEHAPIAAMWNAAQPVPPTQPLVSHHPHAHGLPLVSPTNLHGPTAQPLPPLLATEPVGTGIHALPSLSHYSLETSPEQDSESDSDSELDVHDQALTEAAYRHDRDRYLLKMREKGWSYKEIKVRGKFSEAESTLRGRVRVLTKDKSQRVRKPEWTEKDLDLLDKAVRRFSGFDGSGRDRNGRMPWKKVSEWMSKKGSTYVFAPATCAKKFKELN